MENKPSRKARVGKVISDSMEKTIVVSVEALVRHPLYGKTIKRTTKLHAHDERNECAVGDLVKIVETRPLSRNKRWKLVEIVEKAR
ncbi:MAG: 30S ribosomal protein S17 [Actinobacteria bacterium]|nr:30S ribosomal protein S17 [Actinomycetota bacterium]